MNNTLIFTDWFKAVRGFGMLGILLLLIAILTAFVKICLKDRSCVLIISIILSFMAGNRLQDFVHPTF